MILLPLHVGVEQGGVALAPAPEHVVGAAEAVGHLHRLLDLRRGVGEHVRVRVGGGAVHVARVGKQVGGAPQQADAGVDLQLLGKVDYLVQVAVRLRQRRALGGDVAVVEAVVVHAEAGDEVERHAHAAQGVVHRVDRVVPGAHQGLLAKRVHAGAAEGVPVGDGEAEVVRHALAGHDPVGIVVAVAQRVARIGTFVADRLDAGKVVFHGDSGTVRQQAPGGQTPPRRATFTPLCH